MAIENMLELTTKNYVAFLLLLFNINFKLRNILNIESIYKFVGIYKIVL